MTTQTTMLTDFLLARLAEDEAAARMRVAVLDALPPHERAAAEAVRASLFGGEPWDMPTFAPDPARVLAEIEAKRRIVALHDDLLKRELRNRDQSALGADLMHKDVLRALVLPYADHPEFDEAWAL